MRNITMKVPILIVLLTMFTNIAPAKAALGLGDYQGDDDAVERWQKISDMLQGGMKKLTKTVLPYAVRLSSGLNLSTSCVRDGLHVFNGLRKLDPMATRFIDASGKMIDGIAVGTLGAVGAYDECLSTEIFSNGKDGKKNLMYRGQYCTLELRPPLPKGNKVFKTDQVVEGFENLTKSQSIIAQFAKTAQMFYVVSFRFGLCIPSGCTKDDANQLANAIGNSIYINANVTHCEVKEPNKYYPTTIAAIFVYSLTGFLVLIGSFLDRNRKWFSENGKLFRCLLQFSFFKNFSKLLKVGDRSENLRCLNGIRFFTLCWITLTHTYAFVNFTNLKYTLRAIDFVRDFAFQFVVNAFHISDTFFVIGGTVSCYVVVNYVKTKGGSFNIPMYIINRLTRILPVYIYFLLFVFLLDLFGSGPYWNDFAASQVRNCYEKWWYNLLFINNLFDAESMCAHHTWYLACDFQFYLAAIIILLPLIKRPRVGVSLSVLVIVASAIACGFLTWFYDYPPTAVLNSHNFMKTREYFNYYFFRPYSHIGPYVIGLLLGYILAVKPAFKLSKKIQVLCWALAFTTSFSIIYGSIDWNRGREPTVVETFFYSSLSKNAWALSVAWLIFACATGYGGHVNRFLSWEGFVPLGRLSFMAYLVHPAVILVYISCLQTMQQASHFFLVWLFFGNLCVTFILSLAASMLVEAPFISLTKMMFSSGARTNNASERMKAIPIQSLHLHCDLKPGANKENGANHDPAKVYAEELTSNGIVSDVTNESKEKRVKLSDLIAQDNFQFVTSSVGKHDTAKVFADEPTSNGIVSDVTNGNGEKRIKLSDLIAQNNFQFVTSSVGKHDTAKVYAEEPTSNGIASDLINENKEVRIKLSDLIAQSNSHGVLSNVEKHELEDVKVEDDKTPDGIESNGSSSETKQGHVIEESGKKCHIHHEGLNESKRESHLHQNGFSEVVKGSHIHLNGINNAKNCCEIAVAEKDVRDIDVDVKATYFPGLGWKLG